MAHLWVRDSRADERWAIAPLESAAFTLVADPPYVVPRVPEDDEIGLMKAMPEYGAGDGKAQWVVLVGSPTRVRVNGLAVGGGIRALADRDEIRGPGLGRYFFSTEQLASVEALPAGPVGDDGLFCPRCKLSIDISTAAVCCPVCGVWHHENDDRLCWSYSDACAVCRHDTARDRGYRWSPEEL